MLVAVNSVVAPAETPAENMWWTHSPKLRKPVASIAATMKG